MKLAAKEMGSVKALKETLKKGGGSSSDRWIKNIPAEGITVRFLTEPEQWFGYDEYWDDIAKAFVPMAEGEVLPDGARKSFRYLTIALNTEDDRVIPLKLPKTAANALILKYDKYDTMMDRDYELQKHGEGLDTTYEVTPEGQEKRNLAKYDLLDLEEVLLAARRKALGEETITEAPPFPDDDVDDDDVPEPEVLVRDDVEVDEEALFPDDDFRDDYTRAELEAIVKMGELDDLAAWWELDEATVDAILAAQNSHAEEGDDDEEVDDDEDDTVYDEDDLREMGIRELRKLAESLDIVARGVDKGDLIDAIIDAAEA